ncbi:BZ3500_MvSof-1268-A1-R1_Chr4-2g07065 [Microbotryum saponariae]|uniref:BZ3500_MvSof-1268-A1-R1_Chr4-2g07065 protein n=1 Tax=Microbotryum saponariae TaxID=289078 RepID=A0A2X0LN25_9BASI|nr:BZ3500_MvSof-1268-A1-R1_Chr4-2g07065 [Microbotryum saponariae]SDA06730.1 BZ3501_MvSof-1269-A2-R1_Chr4-2g06776 [Microbotryum saponariae]
MATTLNASMPESKPRTRWLGQQVETDSEDEEDDIEVFWETTSIMSGVPTISPNKMPTTTTTTTTTSTPPRTTSTSRTTTAAGHMTHLAGQKRPANASPPPSYSSSSTATKTASAVATAAASLARRRKKRAGEGCDVPIGQAVDSKTLKMVGQLAIKFSTRSSSAAAAAAVAANASRQSVGAKKNHSAPFLPLRDSTGRMVNVNSARTGMTTESKGKTVARAATVNPQTAPSGTLLDQRARTARRSPPTLISVAPRANHSTSHASSSRASVADTSLRSTNVLTTSVTRVEPIEESRPKSDDFDDLFDGDDSFEHILSQYDEESLISNATTIISSQSMGTTTVCKNDQAKPAVPEQKRSDRILHGVGGQVATKMTTSPLPRLPHASSTRSEVAARGASPRRSARAAVTRTTKSAAAPVTRVMTTTTTAPTASTTKAPARPLPIQRTVSSSSCSQAEAQERLQQELQSLAEQDVSFWSEEGAEV